MGNTTIQIEQIADAGSDGQVLTSTGSGVAWETPAAGGLDKFNVTGVQSNRYYSGLYQSDTGSFTYIQTDSIKYYPFIVWEDCTIDGLVMKLYQSSGNSSGDVAQIAVYGPVPDNIGSTSFKVKTATFAIDSGSTKDIDITATSFTKGIYLYAIVANATDVKVETFKSPYLFVNYIMGSSSAGNQGGLYGSTYGVNTVTTWPHSFASSVSPNNSGGLPFNRPYFQYRVQ